MRDTKALARRSLCLHHRQGLSLYLMMTLTLVLGMAFATMDQITCSCILLTMHMEWSRNSIQSSPLLLTVLLGTGLGAVCWRVMADRIERKLALMRIALLFVVTNLLLTHFYNPGQFTITCFFMGVGVGEAISRAFTPLSAGMQARVHMHIPLSAGILALVPGGAFAAISAHFLPPAASWTSLGISALLIVVVCIQVSEYPPSMRTAEWNAETQRVLAKRQRRTGGNDLLVAQKRMPGKNQQYPPPAGFCLLWHKLFHSRNRANWLPTTVENQGFSDAQSTCFSLVLPFFGHLSGRCRSVSVWQRWSETRADALPGGHHALSAAVWRRGHLFL